MGRTSGRTLRIFLVTLLTVCISGFLATDGEGVRAVSSQSSCLVTLTAGAVQGADLGASCEFLGIPYAASTAGDNRWKPPQPAQPWAPTTLMATTLPPNCASLSVAVPPMPMGNENCLMLNLWVSDPRPVGPAPVLVWLHTGGFVGASANFPGTDGQKLAEATGMIVVAPNYRLGPFGFLYHPALAAEAADGSAGNYGLLDQRAALRWVRDNIAQFGGDPDNVTLAGTSAGGQSVGLHLVSPGSEGLFHRASVQSAYPTSKWMTAAEAARDGAAFATALQCADPAQVVACLRSRSRNDVLTALSQGSMQVAEQAGRVFWEPVVDGVVIPAQPRILFEHGLFHRVPTIIGFNRDEGWGNFVNRSFPSGVSLAQYENWVMTEFGSLGAGVLGLYPADVDPATPTPSPIEALARVTGDAQYVCEARRLARLIERAGVATYLYSYEYEIDTLSLDHVIHGVESNILFGNNYLPPIFAAYTLNAADLALHADMAGYWSRFAATGNPNTDDFSVVHWPAFKHPTGLGRGADKYIVFDSAIREGLRPRERQCDFFEPFFFRTLLGGVPASAQ